MYDCKKTNSINKYWNGEKNSEILQNLLKKNEIKTSHIESIAKNQLFIIEGNPKFFQPGSWLLPLNHPIYL